MDLDLFIKKFAGELEDTPIEKFTPDTEYRKLEEWGSLSTLSIISMIDEEFGKFLTGADLRSVSTIKELYDFILTK